MGITRAIFFIQAGIIAFASQSCKTLCLSPAHYYGLTGGVASATPANDSLRIGDTIFFNSSIPTKIKYKNGGNADSSILDLNGASDVATDIHFISLLGVNIFGLALDSFYVIPITGAILDNPRDLHGAKTITFIQKDSAFTFSMGLIPLKKGIYSFSIIDIFSAKINCIDASIDIVFTNTDQHLHYLQNIYYGGGQVADIDRTHSYCFKVY